MLRWFYILAQLLTDAGAARRNPRPRFLIAKVEIRRRKLGENRVNPSPHNRGRAAPQIKAPSLTSTAGRGMLRA